MSIQHALRLKNEGKFKEARTVLERHLLTTPNDAAAVHLLGMVLFQQGLEMRDHLLSTPLLDHRDFARRLESARRRMAEIWAANGTNVAFDV